MLKSQKLNRSDLVGATASGLCLLHCMATPLLFIAKTSNNGHFEAKPLWWSGLDYLFLIIAFFAIYKSNKTSSNFWIRKALWVSWGLLLLIILNERIEFIVLAEYVIYIPAISLIMLHLYNQKYCQCGDGEIKIPFKVPKKEEIN